VADLQLGGGGVGAPGFLGGQNDTKIHVNLHVLLDVLHQNEKINRIYFKLPRKLRTPPTVFSGLGKIHPSGKSLSPQFTIKPPRKKIACQNSHAPQNLLLKFAI
jgi:hypothetical protein